MKQDKFLLGILIFIGLLVIVALTLFFSRSQPQPLADDTPEGVVYNYLLALQQGEYERAYAYLVEAPGKPSLWAFERHCQQNIDFSTLAVDFGSTHIRGDNAQVDIVITWLSSGPFMDTWRSEGMALLVQQDGIWKIKNLPWPFWDWNWYQE